MIGYLTSYIKESPFVLFRDGASNSWPHALYLGQMCSHLLKIIHGLANSFQFMLYNLGLWHNKLASGHKK